MTPYTDPAYGDRPTYPAHDERSDGYHPHHQLEEPEHERQAHAQEDGDAYTGRHALDRGDGRVEDLHDEIMTDVYGGDGMERDASMG